MKTLRIVLASALMWLGAVFPASAVEVDLQWLKGTIFWLQDGSAVNAGGDLFIQDAGTTDHRTTYSDEDGTVANTFTSERIVLDSNGRLTESVYIPVGSWKLTVRDADSNTIFTEDNIEGALDTSAFTTTSAAPDLDVISKTSDYTIVSSDLGKCVNVNSTGGDVTLTLISAATAGDGKTLCVRHTGTANQVTIATVSSEEIDGENTYVLTSIRQSVLLTSDGADWHIVAQSTPAGSLVFTVADQLTSPPTSPEAGAWYIINGTPTGNWASFSEGDIVRASGGGSWHDFTPPTDSGWLAYVQDENTVYQFQDSAWVAWSNITAPSADNLDSYHVQYDEPDGTNGAASGITQGAWTKYPLDTEVSTGIAGASLASNVITLDSGNYVMNATITLVNTDTTRIRWRQTNNTAATVCNGPSVDAISSVGVRSTLSMNCSFNVAADDTTFELQYFAETNAGDGAFGIATTETGSVEVYGEVHILQVDTIEGPQGSQGAQGAQGDAGLAGIQYKFDTDTVTTSDGDATDIRFSSGTLSAVTEIAIDDQNLSSVDVSAYLVTVDDSDSTVRSTVIVQAPGTPSDIWIGQLDGACTDESGWVRCPVTHVASNGTFAEDENVNVSFARTGDKGDTGNTGATGAAGPTVDPTWTYSAGVTGADPGSGNFEFSSETLSAVTSAYFDDESTSGGAVDLGGWIATWDDFGTAANRGQLILIDVSDSTAFAIYDLTAVADSTGYWTASLSHVASNGTFAGEVAVSFAARGDTGSGDVTGPGSSTDNAVVRFDGAGGSTIQNSGWTISDADLLTAAGDLDMGTTGNRIDLDTDNDTSIRASADDVITFEISGQNELVAELNSLRPSANDGMQLGQSGTGWADLFLADGGTINANAGNTVATLGSGAFNVSTGTVQEGGVDIAPIGQHTVFWPAPAFLQPTTNAAASGSTNTGSNEVVVSTQDFDGVTTESIQTPIFQMPGSWDEGTIVAEVLWLSSATTASVVWGVQGQCFADDAALDSSWGTQVTASDAATNAVDILESGELTGITLSNAGVERGCILRVQRVADDSGDTLDGDAEFLGLRIHITTDAATDD